MMKKIMLLAISAFFLLPNITFATKVTKKHKRKAAHHKRKAAHHKKKAAHHRKAIKSYSGEKKSARFFRLKVKLFRHLAKMHHHLAAYHGIRAIRSRRARLFKTKLQGKSQSTTQGKRFKGRAPIQLTGRANDRKAAKAHRKAAALHKKKAKKHAQRAQRWMGNIKKLQASSKSEKSEESNNSQQTRQHRRKKGRKKLSISDEKKNKR